MTNLKADDLNYMVYRYLQGSGLKHTAFNFWHEASIGKIPIDPSTVPSGAIETFVQKGIQNIKLESNLNEKDFYLITLCDLLTKEETAKQGREPIDISIPSTPRVHEFHSSEVLTLKGHTSKVFTCAWSPVSSYAGSILVDSFLASGSGDTTTRIWTLEDTTSGFNLRRKARVLKHYTSKDKHNEVIALDWKHDGTFLATGSSGGKTRFYSSNGEVNCIFGKHEGAISCIKWNQKDDYVLTGSHDNTAIVWDANAKRLRQHYKFSSGPILDADWKNDLTFATGSADAMLHVYEVGKEKPVKKLCGHKGEVNCVKWDPTGALLTSCASDTTVKIWSAEEKISIRNFKNHTKEVYKIRWAPTTNTGLLLASASLDSTVKLWNVVMED